MMIDAGYKKLGSGPCSTTVKDPEMNISVDLYKEVAVSHIIYLDKDKLSRHIAKRKIPGNAHVEALLPKADVVALIAHSIIKEHMYTLSEYYSFLYYLAEMDSNEALNLVNIIRDNAIMRAAKTHIALTATLHEAAHGETPKKIERIANDLRVHSIETRRLVGNRFQAPYKFHTLTLLKAFLEKIREDERTRKSVAKQMTSMMNPSFTKNIIKEVVKHHLRETY